MKVERNDDERGGEGAKKSAIGGEVLEVRQRERNQQMNKII